MGFTDDEFVAGNIEWIRANYKEFTTWASVGHVAFLLLCIDELKADLNKQKEDQS